MLDYEKIKREFAHTLSNKLEEDPNGRGQFESAFYHEVKYAYETGLNDGRQARVAHDASLDEIALSTSRNLMPLMTGSIKELCQLQAKIQIAVREALDKVHNAIELTGSPLAASPATGGSDVE